MTTVIHQRRASYSDQHGQRDNKESFKDYSSLDSEHVAAIAAATFAVHSFEERTSSQIQRKDKTRVEVEANSSRTKMSLASTKAPSFRRPSRPREPPYANTSRNLSIHHGSGNTKLDAWEKTELLKIQKQYEKSSLTILEWENEKKARAKHRAEEKMKKMEQRRSISWQHYQNKLARIDHVAGGARSQAEDKKRKDEKKIKQRANEMRSLGVSSPKYCFLC